MYLKETMTELEQLLEDYYKDNAYIASMKSEWLDPSPVIEKQVRKAKGKLKDIKQFLNEREHASKS